MYTKIRKQLEPYNSIVFYKGLKDDEITKVENLINKKLPSCYREFLKTFGILQDFVFGLMRTKDDFNTQNYLPEDIQQAYIIIGGNEDEGRWLLNTKDNSDQSIYTWDEWDTGEIKRLDFNFQTLLENSLTRLSQTAADRVTNEQKHWSVQFSVSTNDVNEILSVIPIKMIGDWATVDISPAGVYSYEADIMLHDKVYKLKRQEYEGLTSPCYYLDMQESVLTLTDHSIIEDIDSKLSKLKGYKLIDYGILGYQ